MNSVTIEFNRCKECLYCVAFCPKRVLGEGETINQQGYYTPEVKEPGACIACAVCARVCPEGAITVLREEKQEGLS